MSTFKRESIGRRGLQELKTTAGLNCSRKIRKPHEAYLELSSLELERHRLGREKAKAEFIIKETERRFDEIDRKKKILHGFIKDPPTLDKKKGKKRKKVEPIPSYSAAPVEIKERAMTY